LRRDEAARPRNGGRSRRSASGDHANQSHWDHASRREKIALCSTIRPVQSQQSVPVPQPSPTSAASALLVGIALLMVGNGLAGTLVGVRAELEDFGTLSTGVVIASYFAGFLVGSKLAFRLLENVGHIRVFAALASLASTVTLVLAIAVAPLVWAPTRFVTGACMAGLYVVAESWLNDIATPEIRGRLLAGRRSAVAYHG